MCVVLHVYAHRRECVVVTNVQLESSQMKANTSRVCCMFTHTSRYHGQPLDATTTYVSLCTHLEIQMHAWVHGHRAKLRSGRRKSSQQRTG